MSLTVLNTRHLTARDRQAINYALAQGWTSANTGRKWYEIKPAPDKGPGVYWIESGFKNQPGLSRALVRWNDYPPPAPDQSATQAELFT